MKETIELIPDQLISTEQDNTDVKESILIVEDNKEMNDYLAEIFSKDYQVFRAYNGAEACKLLKKQLPDLIVSDVMMPVMDGLELTAYVKQDLNSSHIPVILLTAKTDELDHTQGYLKGADAYITKPFNAQNLELLVQNMRTNRKQNIEYFKRIEKLNITQITNNPRDEVFMKELVDLIMANIKLPDFLLTSFQYVGNMATPLSLMVIGIEMTGISLASVRWDRDIIGALVGRFLVCPACVLVLLPFIPVTPMSAQVFTMQASMPAMTQMTVVAKSVGADVRYSTEVSFITVVMGIVIIPLYMFIIGFSAQLYHC